MFLFVFFNLIGLHTEGSNWSSCLVLGWLVFEGEGEGKKKECMFFFFFFFFFFLLFFFFFFFFFFLLFFFFFFFFEDGLTRCMAVWLVIAFYAYT